MPEILDLEGVEFHTFQFPMKYIHSNIYPTPTEINVWANGYMLHPSQGYPDLYSDTGRVFSYKLRYIVGFGLVEMTISTNPKPTIYRNWYDNTGPGWTSRRWHRTSSGHSPPISISQFLIKICHEFKALCYINVSFLTSSRNHMISHFRVLYIPLCIVHFIDCAWICFNNLQLTMTVNNDKLSGYARS